MLMMLLCLVSLSMITFFSECMIFIPFLVILTLLWLLKSSCSFVSISIIAVDTLSWSLIFLSLWIILMMVLGSHYYKILNYFFDKFMNILISMLFLLILTFSLSDMIFFYIFFESSLIPIYLLIVGWGYQPERLQAGLYILLYTIFGSLPLLISLIGMSVKMGSASFLVLKFLFLKSSLVNIWFFFSIFAFLVKLPTFFVHLWLPKAHVEAPVSGSMMLAGVLLKLGCYGLMRLFSVFSGKVMLMSSLLISTGLIGGVFVSFICLRQVDLKSLVAYSSVSHMGLALAGLGSWGLWGFSSCLYTCIAHGLCSSALFYLSGIVYDRSNSRSLVINKGLLEIMPSMAFWWFLFCISNMAAPVVLNLLGELGLLGSILSFSFYSMLILMLFSFMAACYSLFLFSSLHHGKNFFPLRSSFEGSLREFLVLFLHFYPLVLLTLAVDFITYFST